MSVVKEKTSAVRNLFPMVDAIRVITADDTARVLESLPDRGYRTQLGLDDFHIASIDAMLELNNKAFHLAARLATTGGKLARLAMLENISDIINNTSSIIGKRTPADLTPADAYEQATFVYRGSERWQMMLIWNFNNVAEEAGLLPNISREFLGGGFSHDCIQVDNESYWRGVGALHLTELKDNLRQYNDAESKAFRDWAAAQEDIGAVIHLARDRNTLDVPTLKALMEVGAVSVPLSRGTL